MWALAPCPKFWFWDKRSGSGMGQGPRPECSKTQILGTLCAKPLIVSIPPEPTKAESAPAVAVGGGWSGRRGTLRRPSADKLPGLYLYLIIGNTVDFSIYTENCGESRINTIVLSI